MIVILIVMNIGFIYAKQTDKTFQSLNNSGVVCVFRGISGFCPVLRIIYIPFLGSF